jgi:hypothetical protein
MSTANIARGEQIGIPEVSVRVYQTYLGQAAVFKAISDMYYETPPSPVKN